jgi:hypothetical protein
MSGSILMYYLCTDLEEVSITTTILFAIIDIPTSIASSTITALYFCVCIRYRGNVSTEPLPSNDRGTFTEPTRCLATIGGDTHTHKQQRDLLSLLYFLK